MQRDPRANLWDAREAAAAILEFVAGKTFEDYSSDRLLRSAVERQFESSVRRLVNYAKSSSDGPIVFPIRLKSSRFVMC